MLVSELRKWYTVSDYTEAKEAIARKIAGRYSRGNISVQSGRWLDNRGLKELSKAGDKAMASLKKMADIDER